MPEDPDLNRSAVLSSKDPDYILRHFRTLRVALVDDPGLADVVLKVGYTLRGTIPSGSSTRTPASSCCGEGQRTVLRASGVQERGAHLHQEAGAVSHQTGELMAAPTRDRARDA